MKKSILYLAVYDPHVPLTGTGMRGAEFVNQLAEHFYVDLVYIDGSGQPPIPELSIKYASKVKGVREKYVIGFNQLRYFLFSLEFYRKSKNLIEKHHHDYILCDYGLSAIYGLLLSKKYKTPLIYCSHNIEYMGYLDKVNKDIRRLFLAPYVYCVERAAVQRSEILVPITQEDADHYKRWTTSDKMIVIPQGFDEKDFNPYYEPPRNRPKIVLFCGNYNIQFNRDVVRVVVEEILEKLLDLYPDTQFLFLGANPPTHYKHPNVVFTGFVDDYPAYLKKADVVISPMLQGRGSPTKIFEALACGKTVISTSVGARSLETDFKTLKLGEIEDFPRLIYEAFRSKKPVIDEDFDKVKSRYAWRDTINRLVVKIKEKS